MTLFTVFDKNTCSIKNIQKIDWPQTAERYNVYVFSFVYCSIKIKDYLQYLLYIDLSQVMYLSLWCSLCKQCCFCWNIFNHCNLKVNRAQQDCQLRTTSESRVRLSLATVTGSFIPKIARLLFPRHLALQIWIQSWTLTKAKLIKEAKLDYIFSYFHSCMHRHQMSGAIIKSMCYYLVVC